MVMRPDFSQTYSRGVARIAGTVLGVAVASAVIRLAEPNDWISSALAVLCIGGAYLTLRTGYAAMTACVTMYVVFLLAMDGAALTATGEERVAETLVGGALALAAYALFPTWQTVRLPDLLAGYIETGGRYAAAAVAAFGAPAAADRRAVREALLDYRQARADLLTADQQAAVEPVRHRGLLHSQVTAARSAMAALGRSAMLLEAHLPAPRTDPAPVPGAARFAEALRAETARAAQAVRLDQSVDLSAVRPCYEAWAAELPAPAAGSTDPAHLVVRDAGLLADALEGLQDALGD
jgi:uncharacterized membrane protein YccC